MARIENGKGGGSFSIPELTSDPVSPCPGETWVLKASVAGTPIGLLLALTYGSTTYLLSYRTTENTTVRVQLS